MRKVKGFTATHGLENARKGPFFFWNNGKVNNAMTKNSWWHQNFILEYEMKNEKTKYKNARIRRLTPTECARLQTIPEWYRFRVINKKGEDVPASDTAIYKALGNGWTIEVIKHIFSFLPESMKNNSQNNS